MKNLYRNNQIIIRLNDEEKELFEKKKVLSKVKTMNDFIRKCVLEKDIYVVDTEPFRDIQWTLSNISNNINQVAKKVNTIGLVYKDDIDILKKEVDKMSKMIVDIHSLVIK